MGKLEGVVPCPHCGAEEENCPHLLALIDETFSECGGGYASTRCEEFSEVIEDSLSKLLRKSKRKRVRWNDKEIQELWHYALKNYSPEDGEVSLDPSAVTNLIVKSLKSSGGEYSGPVYEEGGPGLSSVLCLLYAEKPKKAFDAALSKLKARLRKANHSVHARRKTRR